MRPGVAKLLPWLAGAGLAVSQTALSSGNCTVPRSGQCSACGSCVVVLGVLVSWAVLKKRSGGVCPSQPGADPAEHKRVR